MQRRAVGRCTQEVAGLLDIECPTLYKHLVKIFSSQAGRGKYSLSLMHKCLGNIIHQLMQNMFVGMVFPISILASSSFESLTD